jgi:peptidoglycan/xylan/chitin deacetylase (PgdA/CDA1 family)
MIPIHHQVLASSYYPLKFAKAIGRAMRLCSPNRLRVLLYHDIAPHEQAHFAAQLRRLLLSWNFVTPERFAAMVSGAEPIRGPNLLLTFDDGFASNRTVVEQVLNPMGIKAVFFVVSDFVDIKDPVDALSFITKHICPGRATQSIPKHWRNMVWDDLNYLLDAGHTIGAHTLTHARLSELTQAIEMEDEIVESANVLERNLGVKIEHFAHPFGNLASISPATLSVAQKRFRFIYSGLRGDNAGGVSPFALRRDAVTAQDSMALLGAFLEGCADFHYARFRTQLNTWALYNSPVD